MPGGRLLNHGISRPPADGQVAARSLDGFIDRYVFPDGELHEVGRVVSRDAAAGLRGPPRRERCASTTRSTLRHWVANLEANWDEAVDLVGRGRARVWRLYMAASALNFERGAPRSIRCSP